MTDDELEALVRLDNLGLVYDRFEGVDLGGPLLVHSKDGVSFAIVLPTAESFGYTTELLAKYVAGVSDVARELLAARRKTRDENG